MRPSVGSRWELIRRWDGILVVLNSHWSGDRVVNDLQNTTLLLTWFDRRLDWLDPINRPVISSPSTYMFIPTVLSNLHLEQVPNAYILGARRWWLMVTCFEKIIIWPVQRILFGNCSKNNPQLEYSPQPKRMVSPLVHSQHKLDSMRKYTIPIAFAYEKNETKRNLSDSENEAAEFCRFIVI